MVYKNLQVEEGVPFVVIVSGLASHVTPIIHLDRNGCANTISIKEYIPRG